MDKLDFNAPVSLYYQLKELLIAKIKNKEWEIDTKIPTEFELCKQYKVSRITVRQALAEMEKEGYLSRKQGRGTFVTFPEVEQNLMSFYSFSEEFKKKGFKIFSNVLQFKIIDAEQDIADKLKIRKADKVFFIERLRFADEMPFALEETYLPAYLFKGLTAEQLSKDPMYDVMRNVYNVIPDSAEESFDAIIVSERVADLMHIQKRSAALAVERNAYSTNTCIEYTKSIVKGIKFRTRLKK